MGWDGTLYVLESDGQDGERIVGIDSQTGLAKFRVPLHLTTQTTDCDSNTTSGSRRLAGPLTVPDGIEVAVQVAFFEGVECDGTGTSASSRLSIQLLRVNERGEERTSTLQTFTGSMESLAQVTLHRVIPDGIGGLIAPMFINIPGQRPLSQIVRTHADAAPAAYPLPIVSDGVVGSDWAYMARGHVLVAFDPVSGHLAWTRMSAHAEFVLKFAAVGGVVVEDGQDMLLYSSENGTPRMIMPAGAGRDAWPRDLP
jgi:outer membrane protein assembly factor BamB